MYTEQTNHRQDIFEDCLLKNMQAKPYSQISVSDLCQQTGISRKSFYRYFGNKDGCLNALLDRMLLRTSDCDYPKDADYHNCPEEIVQQLVYWKNNRHILGALHQNGLTFKLVERIHLHVITEERDLLQKLGLLNRECQQEILLFSITGYVTLIFEWHISGYERSVAEMSRLLVQIMTNPLISLSGTV